jgi:hypothetical protein
MIILSIKFILSLFLLLISLIFASAKFKGIFGEKRIINKLKRLNKEEYEIINDITLCLNDNKICQIDHVVISIYGVFVIETKNYQGWIFGNEKSENWTQIIYKEKHYFRNPVKQNWSHVYALKEILKDFDKIKYFPVIVFSGSGELKVKSNIPVIYGSQILSTIKNAQLFPCMTRDEVLKISSQIRNKNIVDKKIKKKHIQNIKRMVYEREVKQNKLICPKCNGELILRKGKYGLFYGCSNYPHCQFTMKY